jgi:hypothetical protein
MNTTTETRKGSEALNILLIGNNPIDMGRTLDKLQELHGVKVITEIAFDLRSILERLMKFSPNFILIDDNIGRAELTLAVNTLSNSRKTKNIPITVIKNSNYQESYGSSGIMDYILKNNLSAESFYSTVRNVLKFKRTQRYLYQAYARRKNFFMKITGPKLQLRSDLRA